ncbi:MAG: VOC family protein [Hyphomonas sp.]|uniref:VOC family protein n=1 Tax=Hyphomonas sp. TaxID=87 RepID=UPI0034A0A772
MKRLHVHVAADDLVQATRFCSTLFAAGPAVTKPDDAELMLDDPRLNFAISARGARPGVEHLAIQADTDDELREVHARLKSADAPVLVEGATTCCYAQSAKSWINDPAGVAWEVFHTTGESAVYGGGPVTEDARLASTPTGMAIPAPAAAALRACCG